MGTYYQDDKSTVIDPIKVVIVDDEPLARDNLRDLLAAYPEVIVKGEAGSVEEAARVIDASEAEAVFLDIQMPGESGFELLPRLEHPIQIVFATAYDKYAIRAFEINAVDYLLKPIERPRLSESIHRLRAGSEIDRVQPITVEQTIPSRLTYSDDVLINAGCQCFFMPVSDIAAVTAAGDYVKILVANGRDYILRETIKQWLARLPEEHFAQLDRSLIVNMDHIRRWRPHGRKMEITFYKSGITLLLGRAATSRFQRQNIEACHTAKHTSH